VNGGPQEGQEFSVWDRLRRRKVVQWGVAYVAGAWGFLQGFEYASNTFDWPHRLQQLLTIGLLIGLPMALVIAWYHGDRGEQRVTRIELAILTLLFVLGGGLFWRYERANVAQPATTGSDTIDVSSGSTPEAAAANADVRPSIAVLPFENRSSLQDDAFLVDGIHDDILTQLSRVGAMKVIARTSVEQFRDTRLSLREIGKQLGVANVLEGGVQRAGNRVRITVQLIDVATEAHLWAESYDRELTVQNIFEIQSEVARAIASELRAALMPAEKARLAAIPTQSLAAWEAYQNGRQRMSKRTITALSEAQEFFRKAIELDPRFALAYAGLADATWLTADFSGQPMEPAIAKAEDLIGQALRLDPDLAEARVTLAKFAADRREFERAESLYREAIALNPSYAQAYHWYSQLLGTVGRDDEAMQALRKAVELDPMAVYLRASLAWALSGNGRFDESLREFEMASKIDPQSPLPYRGIGAILATGFGRLDEAVPYLQTALDLEPASLAADDRLGQVYLDLGDEAQVVRLMELARANGLAEPPVGAYLHLQRGDQAAVLESGELRLLRDADLRNNDARSALARYQHAFPELLQPGLRALDWRNYLAAVELAFVLQSVGDVEQAARLLQLYDSVLATWPRLGPWGYGVTDAQVFAMKDRPRDALAALRTAQRAGWRGPYWRYYRDFDPTLASIRSDPEFKAIFDEIERDVAQQRDKLAARPKNAPLPIEGAD
jgi:TolB-like protein/Tfp pilus assembly protein PilF